MECIHGIGVRLLQNLGLHKIKFRLSRVRSGYIVVKNRGTDQRTGQRKVQVEKVPHVGLIIISLLSPRGTWTTTAIAT